MKCPKCGRENTPGAPFCADCGKSLFPTDEAHETASSPTPDPLSAREALASEPSAEPSTDSQEDELILAINESANPEVVIDDPQTDALLSAISAGSIRLESTSDEDGEPVLTTVESSSVVASPEEEADFPTNPDHRGSGPLLNPAPQWEPVSAQTAQAPEPTAVSQPQAAPQPETAPDPAPSAASAADPAQAAPEAAAQGAPIPEQPIIPPNPARVHPSPMQSGPEAQYQKGCLAAAWGDIMQTKGWFGKVLLLGLVGCVPILNFYVNGYAMRWSRELFLGKVAPMPDRIFGNRMFINGFFAFIIGLLLSIVGGLCSALLGAVPIVGAICGVAIYLIIALFQYIAVLRTAIADRLGAAFDIAQIWRTCWRNLGALLCATIVPILIYTAVVFVIVFALMVIVGLPLIGTIAEIGVYGSSSYAAALLSLMGALIPVFLICYIVGCFLDAFLTLLTTRATGHYVARYAQDWKAEQAVMSTAHINGI